MENILLLSVRCIAGPYLEQDYRCVLALAADATLDDLAGCILDAVDFDGEHLSDFYLASGPRGNRTPLTDDEGGDGNGWQTALHTLFPLERNKKLYYLYDYGASWRFEIATAARVRPDLAGKTLPCVVLEDGERPLEYGPDEDD